MVFSTTIFHFINFLLYIHGIIISLKKEVNHMIMHNDWDQLFDQEIQKDYLLNLRYFLAKEYKTKNIYPAKENIFAAFKTTSLKDTKVVILGQDPYHGPGQAVYLLHLYGIIQRVWLSASCSD